MLKIAKIFFNLFLFPVILTMFTGCAAKAQSGLSSKLSSADAQFVAENKQNFKPDSFKLVSFNDFPDKKIPASMHGESVKINVSYLGVAPGFGSGEFRPIKFITFLISKPIDYYMANNPMRGPRDHVFAVIESERSMEIYALPKDKNFNLYGQVVRLGGNGETGEFGIKVMKFE